MVLSGKKRKRRRRNRKKKKTEKDVGKGCYTGDTIVERKTHKSLLNLERVGHAVCRVIYQDSPANITVE